MWHNFKYLTVNCAEISEIELEYIVMEDEWLRYFNHVCSHFMYYEVRTSSDE